MMNKLLSTLLGLLITTTGHALPKTDLRAGGLIVESVGQVATGIANDQKLATFKYSNQLYVFIGIPLDAENSFQYSLNGETKTVQLRKYPYKEQHLTIKNQAYVEPDPEQLKRFAVEAKEQNAVYDSFSIFTSNEFPQFKQPTKGKFSSSFGLKRFFNGQPRKPHAGLDIASPTGQAVYSPAQGVVAQTGDYFFNGKTVMIDHGQGLISMVCHLSKINVKQGDVVNTSDIVGLVGATGRATGAHLHWTVSLNGAKIDPVLFLK